MQCNMQFCSIDLSWSQTKVVIITQFSFYSVITELLPYKFYSVLNRRKTLVTMGIGFFFHKNWVITRKTLREKNP